MKPEPLPGFNVGGNAIRRAVSPTFYNSEGRAMIEKDIHIDIERPVCRPIDSDILYIIDDIAEKESR